MRGSKTSAKSQDDAAWFILGDFAEAAWEVKLDGVEQVALEVEGAVRSATVVWFPTPARDLQPAHEVLDITELEPDNGKFIGKRIRPDGSIKQYPLITWWRQRVAQVPASVSHLFAYLREARTRNICLIRGAPANLERQPTRRRKADADFGFLDEPTKLFFLDIDGIKMKWRDNPEGAVRNIVARLGEPWASTSFVWFFSSTHGLKRDKHNCWTGKISDEKVYVRLAFITDRALGEREAVALTNIIKVHIPELDRSICFTVQPSYVRRPRWSGHPDEDVLGDIPTIGWIKGTREYLPIPDDLTHKARWAKAQGHSVDIADHDDAISAVRGIASDGRVRQHLLAAVQHLLLANPVPDPVSFTDHSIGIVDLLQGMIERHRDEIETNLERHHRHWADVLHYLSGMADWGLWLLNHPSALQRKTIKLVREEPAKADDQVTREAIFARVAVAIERARKGEAIKGGPRHPLEVYANEVLETPPVVLLIAPTGARKSTLVRANAVKYVAEHPGESVAVLMPRHKLGDEQIEMLHKEHPGGNFNAAVWRGRHADDPDSPDPERPGKFMPMCWRSDEMAEGEKAMLNIEHNFCKQGRGAAAIKCPFYDRCGYQKQKQVEANIWFAAHECMTHEMPRAFGKVGWIVIDESPLDAFTFGVDRNDTVELELDALRSPLTPAFEKVVDAHIFLKPGRDALYQALDKLRVPIDRHKGVPVSNHSLVEFYGETLYGARARNWQAKRQYQFSSSGHRLIYGDYSTSSDSVHFTRGHDAHQFYGLEWRGKVVPDIRPDMTKKQVCKELEKAAGNSTVKKRAILWQLIEQVCEAENKLHDLIRQARGEERRKLIKQSYENRLYGRVQIHQGKEGRVIRMVGLREVAKDWNVPTLICDATGDAELLRAIWPKLETDESVQGWQQLPRPKSVRIFQCVNRTISKWAIAVEGKHIKEIERKIEGARRLYAAVLMKAMEYGGQEVGVILYKSTREWIEKNCFVPSWMKLVHWGDVTGTNKLEKVRALFVIGRPLAAAEDVTRQAEALSGNYIDKRDYVERRRKGRIQMVPDAKGNNFILVDVKEHPHPMGERVNRQICQGSIIQAVGRARAGLRGDDEPLDIHLWTDVPVPELGAVEPVLWGELAADLDALMLASGGVWLESIPHAAQAYPGLFTADGLKSGRKSKRGCSVYRDSYMQNTLSSLFRYQKVGRRQRPAKAWVLAGIDARAWLEKRLGPLAHFEVEGMPVGRQALYPVNLCARR